MKVESSRVREPRSGWQLLTTHYSLIVNRALLCTLLTVLYKWWMAHPNGVTPNSEGQRPGIYPFPDGCALNGQHHKRNQANNTLRPQLSF